MKMRVRKRARERLASGVPVASEVLNNEGRPHHSISVIPSASEGPNQTRGSHKLTLALNRVLVSPPPSTRFGMTSAMFRVKVGRQFHFAGNELKNSREPFLTS